MTAKSGALVGTPRRSLDVVLLLDDPTEFGGRTDGFETFLFVSEVIDAIEPALRRLGHRSRRLSFAMGVPALVESLAAERPDVVFHLGQPVPTDPASEAQATALLDLLGLAHTSESPETLILARDKARAKAIFAHHGILTPWYAVSSDGELPDVLPPAPWIAKPSLEDGSVGVACETAAHDHPTLGGRVRALYDRFHEPILVESFIDGREFQVGLVGSEILPFVEIDFSKLPDDRPHIIGYETKWKYDSVEFNGTRRLCPAPVSESVATDLRRLARRTAAAFGLTRCSRLDIRMNDRGELYVLDVNPNPDLSPVATTYLMAKAAGWGFDGLVQRLLELAQRGQAQDRHRTSSHANGKEDRQWE